MDLLNQKTNMPHRATIDRSRLNTRSVVLDDQMRGYNVARHDRQMIRRAAHPQHRQPRVRLGKPTGPNAYVHWQEYLDIADLHRMPKTPQVSADTTCREELHHETVSEMFARYRHVAEHVNEKINSLVSDLRPRAAEAVEVNDGLSLED